MAAFSAVPAIRTGSCDRLPQEPHLRVLPRRFFKITSSPRLGFHHGVFRPLRVMRGSGRCMAHAATEDKSFIANGGLQSCSLYDFLGLPQDASQKNIKEAYRKSAKIWHPDIANKEKAKNFAEEFVKIHDAYSVLSDPEARARYDEQLRLQALQGRKVNGRFPGIVSLGGYDNDECQFMSPLSRNWETDQCW
uniref:J domain-containing protein n=1 Tax=Araucaria cunninghamii TaxID=56994 RepID=A0A0D6QZK4_ARACU